MKLEAGIHLAYCTNVHRGETWAETFATLERHTLAVRRRVAAGRSYAIGLRLGRKAATELAEPSTLLAFQRWLDRHDCYVFTINGFPYGSFHGTRVKEQVYAPDWSTPERVDYTLRLFSLLAELAPPGAAASVSTVPASFKAFVAAEPARRARILANLTTCARRIAELAARTDWVHQLSAPELAEIEASSRLYLEDGAVFMTANLIRRGDNDEPESSPVTFIVKDSTLVTVRYHHPQAFPAYVKRAVRPQSTPMNGWGILISLLEAGKLKLGKAGAR